MLTARERLLSTTQAAAMLGLSPQSLYKHVIHGAGPQCYRINGLIKFLPEDIVGWKPPQRRRRKSSKRHASS